MIDIHSHIISGIDDGAKNTEMTIKMLEMAEESGTTDIVATPHFMRGRFEVTYKEVIDEVENLKKLAKENSSFVRKIEVETEYKEQILEAIEAGADIIMLDNMTPNQAKEMVKLIAGRAITECSGNITLDTIRSYALSGVDFISSGELTHSVKAFDISLKNFTKI